MSPIAAKVTSIEKRGDQYQVIIQISPKYRGSFNTLAFGEIKPHSGSLRDGRLDLVYHQNPALSVGDTFPLWTQYGGFCSCYVGKGQLRDIDPTLFSVYKGKLYVYSGADAMKEFRVNMDDNPKRRRALEDISLWLAWTP
jgi:hypothetical protein